MNLSLSVYTCDLGCSSSSSSQFGTNAELVDHLVDQHGVQSTAMCAKCGHPFGAMHNFVAHARLCAPDTAVDDVIAAQQHHANDSNSGMILKKYVGSTYDVSKIFNR